ncbi:ATP-binding protein [bacterium]|nr:ATP-binding protein [bacterium]
MVASKDPSHPDFLIPHGKVNLLKAAAIYGANASGKSNLVKAISCMRRLVKESATKLNQGDSLPGVTPFRLEPSCAKEPSSFEVTAIVDGVRYDYGFAATKKQVHEEWLVAYPKDRPRRLLDRKFLPSTGKYRWACRWELESEKRLLRERTRPNGLALSHGAQFNVGVLSTLYLWFTKALRTFDLSEKPEKLVRQTARAMHSSEETRQGVLRLLQHADMGIIDVATEEKDDEATNLFKALDEFLKTTSHGPASASFDHLAIRTMHHAQLPDSDVEFDLQKDESNGTQRLFALAGPVVDALRIGSTVVVDELDCSMHPLLTHKIVELFQSESANPHGAQLIFVTHDSSLMSPDLLRRDQIWFAEKNRSGATELFSLYDFKTEDRPRSTTAFEKNYLTGKYGGVPSFGPALEDLEI